MRKELIIIEKLKKIGDKVFQVYFGIGVAAMGLLAVLVIFSVIARYFFSHSWKELSEFNVTLFAFTTFWGMGINVLKNEHVIIDILYDRVPPAIKRWLSVVNYLIVLAVDVCRHQEWQKTSFKMANSFSLKKILSITSFFKNKIHF